MSDSVRKIVLEIIIPGRIIEIPFVSIEKLDNFTSLFINSKEIAKLLFQDENYPVESIKVSYTYKKPGTERAVINYLNVKYAHDNFDEDDLLEKFRKFILNNPLEAVKKEWGLIYVIRNSRYKSNKEGFISDYEIENAIRNLWNKGYKTKRDIYFKLLEQGIEVKINPKELFYSEDKKYSNRINKFASEDPYFEYLQGLSLKGEEEYEYAMEQISMFDIDKIPEENLASDEDKLIDGAEEKEDNIEKDLLSKIEGLSPRHRKELIEEICKIRDSYGKRKKNPRSRRIS